MKILITGGAGYIGSHAVEELVKEHDILVFDNLCHGHRKAVDKKAAFVKGDLASFDEIDNCLRKSNVDAVMHFAGFIEAGESMHKPEKYFENNVVNGIKLLNAMVKNKVKKIIYSSSAGVYGQPKRIPIKEIDATNPINVYGETKLMFEKILRRYDDIHGVKFTALRYFNAAGSNGRLGEHHNPETHLIPLVLKAALDCSEITIFGSDYPIKDGTCIRDYIHVVDLINAHILSLNNLDLKSKIYNLGSEKGYSVREVIWTSKKVTGKKIKTIEAERRNGDAVVLVADSTKIKKELGWKPKYGLKDIIKSAWEWHRDNPNGYGN